MTDYFKSIVVAQFEAALAMLNQCVRACPTEHWEGKIASATFRWVAYHTLFFTDVYLAVGEEAFVLRDLHERGGDERAPGLSPGLSQAETLDYLSICRQKMGDALARETAESLQGPCGFSSRGTMTRGELHIYNIRHIQHHTGQLSAYLRRVTPALRDRKALPWIGSGWR
jgi:uncharacterized damage-inducible protein DinB